MFNSLTLHGGAGSILWGHREAILLRSWRISQDKKSKRWTLTGATARVDPFGARQSPLAFSAPREKGFWFWGIERLEVGVGKVIAHLGPPER